MRQSVSVVKWTALVALAALAACGERRPITAPQSAPPQFAISDAAHAAGNTHFFFLPPMVSQPTFGGTFDADIATLNPQIAICDVTSGPDSNCGGTGGTPAVLVFTTTTTPAITVDPTTPQYQVNWDTKSSGFAAGHTYRAHATAGAPGARRELGFADVLLTSTPGQAKQSAPGEIVVLQYGRTLPIHFRVETGIPGMLSVSAASPTVATGGTDVITATVQDLHGAALAGATVTWSSTSVPATNVVASLAPASGTTAGDGTDAATLTAGPTPGTATVTARADGLSGTTTVTVIPAGFTLASISVGDYQTCGVTRGGVAYCWGFNSYGQLGTGSSGGWFARPMAVTGGLTFSQVGAHSLSTCAVATSGVVYCWGVNTIAQLGEGTFDNLSHPVPAPIQSTLSFRQIDDHGGPHCALTVDGAVSCWGNGFLGDDGQDLTGQGPVTVVGGLTFQAIVGGDVNTCGLTAAGAAYCWGLQFSNHPVLVPGGHVFASLAIGEFHSCGLDTGGAVWCWGTNTNGEFGNGTTLDMRVDTPVPAASGFGFVSLTAGGNHTCGLTAGGEAYCWGRNDNGELGDGTTNAHSSPVSVATTLVFTSLSAGQLHNTCGLTSDGAVYCWGNNFFGTVGDGTFTNRWVPTRVVLPSP